MKKLLRKLLEVLVIIVFSIGLIVLIAGMAGRGGNIVVVFIGFLILSPFIIYLYVTTNRFKLVSKEEINKINDLKNNGVKLPVDLEALKINKTRKSYYSRVVKNTPRSGAWNQIMGNPDKNIRVTEYNNNEVKFKIPYGNNFIKFTKTINMDSTTLLLHFAVKKQTYLYVNPVNMDDYYLDLEFLNTND